MPRAPKRTFKTLPAGASGSSTNPETAARNQRRRKLDPLQAEYERARANRGNRISSKIKRLKKQAAYINASTLNGELSMAEPVRDAETARSADREGGVAEGVFVQDQDEDEDEDEDDDMSAGSEAFDGILYDFDASSEDEDIDMFEDEENVDSEKVEEDVEAEEEVEVISGEELRSRIVTRNGGFWERLERMVFADQAARQKRRKRKGKGM